MATQSRAAYYKRNLGWPLSWMSACIRQRALVERFESALRHLIMTPRGSLYCNPDYGTLIHLLRTQGMSQDMVEVCKAQLRQGISRYIPDILLTDLIVETLEDGPTLRVSAVWIVRDADPSMHGELAAQRTTTVLI